MSAFRRYRVMAYVVGWGLLILLAAMQSVPRDLYESAALDGAGAVRRFFLITIPTIRPTLIFVVITATIGGLQLSKTQILEQRELLKSQQEEIKTAIAELEASLGRSG